MRIHRKSISVGLIVCLGDQFGKSRYDAFLPIMLKEMYCFQS